MAPDRRMATDGAFSGGSIATVLGSAHLDLTRASLAPGESAVVDVFNALGGTEIRVPAHWQVEVRTTTVAGGLSDQRASRTNSLDAADAGSSADAPVALPATAQPRLIIEGVVFMGGVSIK